MKKPDFFIVELYPFGRSIFAFELEPLLEEIRRGAFGSVKAICSLRDILVEKKDPTYHEKRVLKKLNRYFDALLVHSDAGLQKLDETFSRAADISIPLVHTGFITQPADPAAGRRLRHELKLDAGETELFIDLQFPGKGHRFSHIGAEGVGSLMDIPRSETETISPLFCLCFGHDCNPFVIPKSPAPTINCRKTERLTK